MMSKKKTISTNNTTASQTVSEILEVKEIIINEAPSIEEVDEAINKEISDRVLIKFLTSFWSNRKGDEVIVDRKMLSAISKKRYKIIW